MISESLPGDVLKSWEVCISNQAKVKRLMVLNLFNKITFVFLLAGLLGLSFSQIVTME